VVSFLKYLVKMGYLQDGGDGISLYISSWTTVRDHSRAIEALGACPFFGLQ
jgi:hypothetical protein